MKFTKHATAERLRTHLLQLKAAVALCSQFSGILWSKGAPGGGGGQGLHKLCRFDPKITLSPPLLFLNGLW